MKPLMNKLAVVALKIALIALYALPSAAESLPHFAGLLRHTPTGAVKVQTVIVNFHNESLQARELRIGDQSFNLAGQRDLRLRMPVGAQVLVYSPVNRKIDGVKLLTVDQHSAFHEVAVK